MKARRARLVVRLEISKKVMYRTKSLFRLSTRMTYSLLWAEWQPETRVRTPDGYGTVVIFLSLFYISLTGRFLQRKKKEIILTCLFLQGVRDAPQRRMKFNKNILYSPYHTVLTFVPTILVSVQSWPEREKRINVKGIKGIMDTIYIYSYLIVCVVEPMILKSVQGRPVRKRKKRIKKEGYRYRYIYIFNLPEMVPEWTRSFEWLPWPVICVTASYGLPEGVPTGWFGRHTRKCD